MGLRGGNPGFPELSNFYCLPGRAGGSLIGLANASHPEYSASVSQAFPTMLAGLTPRHAKFLEVYFDLSVRSIFVKIRPIQPSVISTHSRLTDAKLALIMCMPRFCD